MPDEVFQPAADRPVSSADTGACSLLLEGGINFRDLGGIVSADGRKVRERRLFRSGEMSRLTAGDVARLREWDVRRVIDFRDPGEVLGRPNVALPGIRYEVMPANPEAGGGADLRRMAEAAVAGGDPHAFMRELYARLPFENPAYRHLLASLRRQEKGALVFHCMAGKDRTGVAGAIVLGALGVEREAIMEDYLRTGEMLAAFTAKELLALAKEVPETSLPGMRVLLSVKEEFLNAMFAAIEERFGTWGAYLSHEFGLEGKSLEQLQESYLC